MKIADFMDLKILQDIQDRFSDSTGLAAIAVDAEGNYITKGSNFTDFCMKYTRGSEEGARRCLKCDNECTGTYFCHAGLMDFSSDILVEGERLGAMIGGQVLPAPPDHEQFARTARELGISPDAYLRALDKVPVRSEKMIRAAADLLQLVVNKLVSLEYIKHRSQRKMEIFDTESKTAVQTLAEIRGKMRDLHRLAAMENILSINASIEAGRAGRAGVGFAVVAKEVGELAKNSGAVFEEIQKEVEVIEGAITRMSGEGV